MSIDFTRPVQTREGRKVRILCTDGTSTCCGIEQPVVGLIEGGIQPCAWTLGGLFNPSAPSEYDLINVTPPKRKVMVEVRLVQTSDGVEAYAKCANVSDVWWPHTDDECVIASTTIEMEYPEQS